MSKDNQFFVIKDLLIKIRNMKEYKKLNLHLKTVQARKLKEKQVLDEYYKYDPYFKYKKY